jgi:ggdef domain
MKRRILIGVIITECHIDFQSEIMRGIISQAFKSNCDIAVITPLRIHFTGSAHKDTEKCICDLILSEKFDGFLYDRNTFCIEKIHKYIDELLLLSGKPVMLLDSSDHKSFESTSVDDCGAFEDITDHLIDVHGLKKIYCLTGPKGAYVSEERLKGYFNSMKKHGLYYNKSFYYYGDFWTECAKELAGKIISGKLERPEAVVCGNDVSAIHLTKALMANGVRVPEDIAVTGYDASDDALKHSPSITSYARPNFQLGAEAFRRLYRIITGKICSKIPNEKGSLRLAESCGCKVTQSAHSSKQREKIINNKFEQVMLYGDMLFDITNTDNIAAFADRLDNYTYFLYKMSHLKVCLTRNYIESSGGQYLNKLGFRCGDEVKVVLSKSPVYRETCSDEYFSSSDILPDFAENKNYPSAFYLSPLHYNDNFFGYIAVSFGKNPMTFRSLYYQWINYVNVALEQVRTRSAMSHALLSTNNALLYDSITGLLSRSGVEKEFSERLAAGGNHIFDCITIELIGIKTIYYRSGEENCSRITTAFADAIKECAGEKEICGMWSSQTFCVITSTKNRAAEIYSELHAKVSESRFNERENFNVDFSVGLFTFDTRENTDLGEAMYKSTVNKIMSYNISENSANPQFEKLCMLRSKIKKDPAYPWNISDIADSLYLSKSYLQKIYKSFFNKSIIEEMIGFRIEKAKRLLIETDLTVTEISKQCGYSSYNYFVRQFRMSEEISPTEYRLIKKAGTI